MPAEVEAIRIGQADVKYDQIEVAAAGQRQPFLAEGDVAGAEAFCRQRIERGIGNCGFVFDEQNIGHAPIVNEK